VVALATQNLATAGVPRVVLALAGQSLGHPPMDQQWCGYESMTTFAQLFREGQKADPRDPSRLARLKAPEILEGATLQYKADLVPIVIDNGVVLGIGFYDFPELELLDRLIENRSHFVNFEQEPVFVFDVLSCKTMDDFIAMLPEFGPVYQTPIVGIWKNGKLIEKAVGGKGHALLARHFNL
jgi:hypothetical protein